MTKVLTRRVLPNQAKAVKADLSVLTRRAGSTNLLDLGDTGKAVQALQRLLSAAGVYTGKASGTFDEATKAALTAFQTAKQLPASGAMDKNTFKALKTVNLFVKPGFKGNAAKAGQRGSDILVAERKLAKLGFLKQDKADGVFDDATKKAVERYRKADPQLKDKGTAISEGVYKELSNASRNYDHDPLRRRDVTSKKGIARHKAMDALVEKAIQKAGKDGLKLGAEGRAVGWVEKHLEAAGYELGRQNNQFGSRTEAAVRAFQRRSGLKETGTVDARTWAKLRGSHFAAASGTSPAQREGEKSGAVDRTEKLLKKLGYNVGKADGLYTEATEKAVKRFQKKQKLNVTGDVGTGTMNAIEKAWKKKNSSGYLAKVVKLAQSQLGVREQPMGSNRQKYSPYFGRPPEPWCADFVSWLYTKSGKKLNQPYTPTLLSMLKSNGTFNRNKPQPGQIIMFDWNPNAGVPAEHTGIVEKVYRKNGQLWVQTIEGNSGNMVRRRNYAVSDRTIAGFGTIK